MKYGYARVSTQDQKLSLQTDALKKAGCDKIFKEKVSGTKADRVELCRLLKSVQHGDTVVVWKLDRLGRSTKDLIALVSGFKENGVSFVSLQDNIDTSTAQGRFFFHVIASFVELERELIRERTYAGLAAARARGRMGGRPKGLSAEAQATAVKVKMWYASKKYTIAEIMKKAGGISKPTVYNYLRAETPEFE